MKKILLSLGLLAVAAVLTTAALAATTANVFIHVTVVTGDISITRDGAADIYFGQVVVNTTTMTAVGTSFHNSGDTLENWSISATNTAAWTFLNNAPGTVIGAINEVRLSALWHSNAAAPLATDYLALDTITNASVQSDATHYAIPADPAGVKGFNVAPNTVPDRYLYFRMDVPITGSTGLAVNQDFTVTVTSTSAI
jgi:hypothetical protein